MASSSYLIEYDQGGSSIPEGAALTDGDVTRAARGGAADSAPAACQD
jgi:hypothetical protein